MTVRSPYPDVEVPKISLPGFVLKHGDQRGAVPAVIDAPTGRTLVRVGDGLAWTT